MFTRLDLAADCGPWTAVEGAIRAHAMDGEGIVERLTARVGETTISSLELRRQ